MNTGRSKLIHEELDKIESSLEIIHNELDQDEEDASAESESAQGKDVEKDDDAV